MSRFNTRALAALDAEVARLGRPRTWAAVQGAWLDDPVLAAASVRELLARLRGSSAETDPIAHRLVVRAAGGDAAAVTVLLASLAGVFVATGRRRGLEVDSAVADQLSLAVELVRSTELPDTHVLAVLVSRVQARHRRLRHRERLQGDGGAALAGMHAADDPARRALARVELDRVGRAVHREVGRGSFTQDDWRRLVELRVHERTSDDIARRESMTPAGVRKRVQRTAAALALVGDAAA